jgi:hypothetical protein
MIGRGKNVDEVFGKCSGVSGDKRFLPAGRCKNTKKHSRCHSERSEESCLSYFRDFTEFTLSEILQSLALFQNDEVKGSECALCLSKG